VANKAAGEKLLSEMWVTGNRFKALWYVLDRADTLYGVCSQWGHSEFRCQQPETACGICASSHRTEGHRCEVATCGRIGKVYAHSVMRCPNCGENHPAQDGRCVAKGVVVAIARGGRALAGPPPEPRLGPLSEQEP
jgi:hypothetical protein